MSDGVVVKITCTPSFTSCSMTCGASAGLQIRVVTLMRSPMACSSCCLPSSWAAVQALFCGSKAWTKATFSRGGRAMPRLCSRDFFSAASWGAVLTAMGVPLARMRRSGHMAFSRWLISAAEHFSRSDRG